MNKNCNGCGTPFEAGSNRARWCPACKPAQVRAANDRYNAKRDRFHVRQAGDSSLTIVEPADDWADAKIRLSVELTVRELYGLFELQGWLINTKAGQQRLDKSGLPVKVLGVCDTTGTPSYGVASLMVAVDRAVRNVKGLYRDAIGEAP